MQFLMERTLALGPAPTLTVATGVSMCVTTAGVVRAARMYAGSQGHGHKQGVGRERDKLGLGGNLGGYSLGGCLQGLTEGLCGAAVRCSC